MIKFLISDTNHRANSLMQYPMTAITYQFLYRMSLTTKTIPTSIQIKFNRRECKAICTKLKASNMI